MPLPTLPDLTIRQLEYLVAVADAPTWAIAAQSVGVSPSALSQGLGELERRLGLRLFEPDGRRRVLRATAAPVLTHARHVLGLTGDLVSWAAGVRSGAQGRVRLGMIDAAAVIHYPVVLQRFRSEQPDVELRLTVAPSGQLIPMLVGGELDLIVCAETPAAAGLDTTPLFEERLVAYGPPGITPGDPSRWGPWVLFPASSHTRSVIVDELRRRGAPIDIVAESHQPEVLREMVELGLGWTVLPQAQAEHGPRPLTGGVAIGTRWIVAIRRAGAVVDPAVDVLAAAL